MKKLLLICFCLVLYSCGKSEREIEDEKFLEQCRIDSIKLKMMEENIRHQTLIKIEQEKQKN